MTRAEREEALAGHDVHAMENLAAGLTICGLPIIGTVIQIEGDDLYGEVTCQVCRSPLAPPVVAFRATGREVEILLGSNGSTVVLRRLTSTEARDLARHLCAQADAADDRLGATVVLHRERDQ